MTIVYTDEEMKWIEWNGKNKTIKDGCPKEIAKSIQNKFDHVKKAREIMEKQLGRIKCKDTRQQ